RTRVARSENCAPPRVADLGSVAWPRIRSGPTMAGRPPLRIGEYGTTSELCAVRVSNPGPAEYQTLHLIGRGFFPFLLLKHDIGTPGDLGGIAYSGLFLSMFGQ